MTFVSHRLELRQIRPNLKLCHCDPKKIQTLLITLQGASTGFLHFGDVPNRSWNQNHDQPSPAMIALDILSHWPLSQTTTAINDGFFSSNLGTCFFPPQEVEGASVPCKNFWPLGRCDLDLHIGLGSQLPNEGLIWSDPSAEISASKRETSNT